MSTRALQSWLEREFALDGVMAGWAIVGLLVVFSLARGLCSVSAKDVLGKTVSKSRRGILMGWGGPGGRRGSRPERRRRARAATTRRSTRATSSIA